MSDPRDRDRTERIERLFGEEPPPPAEELLALDELLLPRRPFVIHEVVESTPWPEGGDVFVRAWRAGLEAEPSRGAAAWPDPVEFAGLVRGARLWRRVRAEVVRLDDRQGPPMVDEDVLEAVLRVIRAASDRARGGKDPGRENA